jgi:hypothetical protein
MPSQPRKSLRDANKNQQLLTSRLCPSDDECKALQKSFLSQPSASCLIPFLCHGFPPFVRHLYATTGASEVLERACIGRSLDLAIRQMFK